MANLKELRNRIQSVGSTMQITSAMKMVSAAKLKKAQDAIQQMRPYAEKLQELLSGLNASLDQSESVYGQQRPLTKVLVIALTSNRGLCGAFNANVIRQTRKIANAYVEQGVEVEIIAIGKKGNDILKKNFSVIANHSEIFANIQFSSVAEVAQHAMDAFAAGEYDKVEVVYNHFKNAGSQAVLTEVMLPIEPPTGEASNNENLDYIFEPGKEEIVEELIPKSLKTQLFKAVLDSNASEHGARMTAMHKATDNAKELSRLLKLDYNKARQAAITNEILEIVGGAAALEG
ncbi:MAG: ATP synthase F1 subunit gamma [Flavobacteriales bacterium]|nr:MAG: ATP synthase F1 subunit gamma [Flavobacteriales bacterium]